MLNEIYAKVVISSFPDSPQKERELEELSVEIEKTRKTLINNLRKCGTSDNEIDRFLTGVFDEKGFSPEILDAFREYFHLMSKGTILYYGQDRYDIEIYNCYLIKDELKQRRYNFDLEKRCWSTTVCGTIDWQEEIKYLRNHGITIRQ